MSFFGSAAARAVKLSTIKPNSITCRTNLFIDASLVVCVNASKINSVKMRLRAEKPPPFFRDAYKEQYYMLLDVQFIDTVIKLLLV